MANSFLTLSGITRKAIQLFRNQNAFLQMIDRQYDDQFAKTGAKIGSQLRIRLPNDYTVRTGQTAVAQNTIENQVTLTVGTQKGVDTSFSSADLALSMDDFATRILEPMVNTLAGGVAADIMSLCESIPNLAAKFDGSSNLVTPDAGTWLAAGAVLDLNSAPRVDRSILADPLTMSRTVASLSGLFNDTQKISSQYRKGLIGMDVLGFDWSFDQLTTVHTTGTATTAAVSGANQTGSTITVSAITGTLKAGDIVTIAGVNRVNRVTKADTGQLMQFVVTADVSNGGTSISIYPALNPKVAGVAVAYQTVTVSPASSAAVTPVLAAGISYRKNFAFLPQAFTMVTADLPNPTGAVVETAREAYDGISLRMIRDYNSTTDFWLSRLDILYGSAAVRPEWAVVVADVL